MRKNNRRAFSFKETAIGLGVLGGVMLGAVTGNIGLWISIGIVLGSGIAFTQNNKKDD